MSGAVKRHSLQPHAPRTTPPNWRKDCVGKRSGRHSFNLRLFLLFAAGAVPFAFLGGRLALPGEFYRPLVGIILWFAALRLLWSPVVSALPRGHWITLWRSTQGAAGAYVSLNGSEGQTAWEELIADRALIDEEFTDAGLPATKPALAVQMIDRAIRARVPFAWVAADSVYGVGDIEQALRRAGKGYVLGVNANHHFGSWAGKPPVAGPADEIAQSLDPSAWRRLSATATRPRSAAGMSQICCMEERSLPDNPRESAEIGGNHTQLQLGLSGPTNLL